MSGIIALILSILIWGAAPPIFKYALKDIPPFTLAFIRFFGASIIMWPLAFLHIRHISRRAWKNILLAAFWGITINIGFFFIGLPRAPSINVHVIGALGPLVLYLLSLWMLNEKAHPEVMKGMLVSLLGVIIILFGPIIIDGRLSQVSAVSYFDLFIGNVCFILSMLGAVLLSVYSKRAAEEVHPFYLTWIQFVVGSITFIPLMLFELYTKPILEVTTPGWIGIVYGIFFSSAIAYFAHNYAVMKMNTQDIAIYSNLMPVISIIVAIPLIHEYPDGFFIIGAIFIFIGIYLSKRHPHFHNVHTRAHHSQH